MNKLTFELLQDRNSHLRRATKSLGNRITSWLTGPRDLENDLLVDPDKSSKLLEKRNAIAGKTQPDSEAKKTPMPKNTLVLTFGMKLKTSPTVAKGSAGFGASGSAVTSPPGTGKGVSTPPMDFSGDDGIFGSTVNHQQWSLSFLLTCVRQGVTCELTVRRQKVSIFVRCRASCQEQCFACQLTLKGHNSLCPF